MANPQVETGYTRISNEIMEALARTRISGEARQMLDVILRKTYGFNKKTDRISTLQFMQSTGLLRGLVYKGRKKLKEMNLITISKKVDSQNLSYSFQKDYEKWKLSPKKETISKKVDSCLPKGIKTVYQKVEGIILKKERQYTKDIHTVFDYFLLKTKKNYKLTRDRQSIIEKRLKEGYTADQMKQAIDNFVLDEWPGRKDFIDIVYCLGQQRGKPDNLERWLNYKPKEQKGKGWLE